MGKFLAGTVGGIVVGALSATALVIKGVILVTKDALKDPGGRTVYQADDIFIVMLNNHKSKVGYAYVFEDKDAK